MNAPKALTARGVKQMLTRAGVDHSELEIAEKQVTARRLDVDYTGPWENITQVVVTGPEAARRDAFHVLFDKGLCVAGYPDRDLWSR